MRFAHLDCSIRKSTDQSVLTAPRSLSQLITSFVGSQCQGIRPALFLALPFASCFLSSLWLLIKILVVLLPDNFIYRLLLVVSSFALLLLYSVFKFLFSVPKNRFQQQLSCCSNAFLVFWWAQMDSNHRPHAYQACALTTWAMRPLWICL